MSPDGRETRVTAREEQQQFIWNQNRPAVGQAQLSTEQVKKKKNLHC